MQYSSGSWGIIMFGLSLLFYECTAPHQNDFMEARAASPETGLVAEAEKIIPGQRIGKVTLGEKLSEVVEKFGQAHTQDATMGHSWTVWHLNDLPVVIGAQKNSELDVYSVRSSDESGQMFVDQIRITAPAFATPKGVGPGTPAEAIWAAYPKAVPAGRYHSPEMKASVIIYDDVEKGIAFEIIEPDDPEKGDIICIAVIVHNSGYLVTDTYLPFYPMLERL